MRMQARRVVLALVIVLAGAAAAYASATLATAPALVSYPAAGQTLYCDIVNIGSSTQTVRIRVMTYSGTVDADSGDIALAKDAGTSRRDSGNGAGAWCKFTVPTGKQKNFRGAAIYDNGSDYLMAIPAQ